MLGVRGLCAHQLLRAPLGRRRDIRRCIRTTLYLLWLDCREVFLTAPTAAGPFMPLVSDAGVERALMPRVGPLELAEPYREILFLHLSRPLGRAFVRRGLDDFIEGGYPCGLPFQAERIEANAVDVWRAVEIHGLVEPEAEPHLNVEPS